MSITWKEGEDLLIALPNYWHHCINKIYEDGLTYEIVVFYLDGSQKHFIAVTHVDAALGRMIDKYKLLVV